MFGDIPTDMCGRIREKQPFQVTNMFDEILCVGYNADLLRCILPQEGVHYGRMVVDIGNFDSKLTAKRTWV